MPHVSERRCSGTPLNTIPSASEEITLEGGERHPQALSHVFSITVRSRTLRPFLLPYADEVVAQRMTPPFWADPHT